jgi:hypothetical protein
LTRFTARKTFEVVRTIRTGPRCLALLIALVAVAPSAALADTFTASTVQSPANPVAAGTLVTYTTTVTNTSGDVYPAPGTPDDTLLDMFLTRYRSDKPPPNQYSSLMPSQGSCTPKATKPPSVDCTFGTMPAGAGATYVTTVVAQVSMENRIAVVRCTSSSDCGTVAVADADTIVKAACLVPSLVGKRLAAARHALTAAHCATGKVRRRHTTRRKRGRVVTQRPAAGTQLAAGAAVALVVGRR